MKGCKYYVLSLVFMLVQSMALLVLKADHRIYQSVEKLLEQDLFNFFKNIKIEDIPLKNGKSLMNNYISIQSTQPDQFKLNFIGDKLYFSAQNDLIFLFKSQLSDQKIELIGNINKFVVTYSIAQYNIPGLYNIESSLEYVETTGNDAFDSSVELNMFLKQQLESLTKETLKKFQENDYNTVTQLNIGRVFPLLVLNRIVTNSTFDTQVNWKFKDDLKTDQQFLSCKTFFNEQKFQQWPTVAVTLGPTELFRIAYDSVMTHNKVFSIRKILAKSVDLKEYLDFLVLGTLQKAIPFISYGSDRSTQLDIQFSFQEDEGNNGLSKISFKKDQLDILIGLQGKVVMLNKGIHETLFDFNFVFETAFRILIRLEETSSKSFTLLINRPKLAHITVTENAVEQKSLSDLINSFFQIQISTQAETTSFSKKMQYGDNIFPSVVPQDGLQDLIMLALACTGFGLSEREFDVQINEQEMCLKLGIKPQNIDHISLLSCKALNHGLHSILVHQKSKINKKEEQLKSDKNYKNEL